MEWKISNNRKDFKVKISTRQRRKLNNGRTPVEHSSAPAQHKMIMRSHSGERYRHRDPQPLERNLMKLIPRSPNINIFLPPKIRPI